LVNDNDKLQNSEVLQAVQGKVCGAKGWSKKKLL
jgi:hypothetical protein